LSNLRKLFSDTAIYGVSSIFGRTINFLLVPLYTAVFAPGEYGVVTELYAYVAFLMVIYLYGVETTFFRFATKYEDTKRYYDFSVSSSLLFALLITSVLILAAPAITSFLGYHGAEKYVIWLALIMALDTLVAVPFAKLRLERKAKRFAFFKISNILTNIGLNLFFLLLCPYLLKVNPESWVASIYDPAFGVGYVFLANLVASGVTLLFFLPDWLKFRFRLDKEKWNEMLTYASPLVIIGLAGVTNEMMSRALLRHLLPEGFYPGLSSLAVLGIFGACYKLSMLMNLSVQSFRYAYEPFFFSKAKEKDSPELFAKVMNAFIIFGCLAFMGLSLILPEVAPLILRRAGYLEALNVVPMLLFGGLLLGVYYNLSIWYKLTDLTKYGAYVTLIGAAATVILNVLLIPILGYEGSAIATVLVYVIMVVVSYVLGQKHYFIPYHLGKGITYLLVSSVSVSVLYLLELSLTVKYLFGFSSIGLFVILVLIFEKKKSIA
jgi:O-antigen/teichoic acid export membrane protein